MLLLILGLLALAAVLNAARPLRGRVTAIGGFFASWLTIELAPWLLFWAVAATALSVATGALQTWHGYAGLAAMGLAFAGFIVIIVRSLGTTKTFQQAMAVTVVDDATPLPGFPRSHVAFPVLMTRRKGVERIKNIVFTEVDGRRLRLDVHRAADGGQMRPGLLQIHGGGWMIGDKREQGLPLLNHMAVCGWVGINANYRLSPKAAWPAHLLDLKQAIRWYREHAEEYGADPDFLCVTGGSAGGHLAAMVALTANDPEYQPGFEDVDTSVRAAVPFYGVYDFTNQAGTKHGLGVRRMVQRYVIQRRYREEPEAFEKASPLFRVHKQAPPFLVVHGDLDVLAAIEDARAFVERLREVSGNRVHYVELRGAQHAFEVFPSYRTARVIEGVADFLTKRYTTHRSQAVRSA